MMKTLTMFGNNIDNRGPDESSTLKKAMSRPDWLKWFQTMKSDIASHTKNGTWELTETLEDRKVIIRQWFFKLKKDCLEIILKYKARWVVHGFKQQKGLDYKDTFAVVIKPMSYKTMIAVGVKKRYKIRHINVVTAFLYDYLDELIYVTQPHLFITNLGQVCRLRKALYGLRQSAQVWYQILVNFLMKLRFHRLE